MRSVKVKRPSATDQRRYNATISGSVEAKSLFSTKMIKLLRRNHNNKKLLLPGAGLSGSWFCRGEIAEIKKSERSVEAKRYRPRYPLPTTIILLEIIIVQQQQPSHFSGTARNYPASRHTSVRVSSPILGGSYVWPAHAERTTPYPRLPALRRPATTCMAPRLRKILHRDAARYCG